MRKPRLSESSGNIEIVSRPIPEFLIKQDKIKGDYILQRYNGSQIGWTYIKSFPTMEAAEKWVLEGIVKKG